MINIYYHLSKLISNVVSILIRLCTELSYMNELAAKSNFSFQKFICNYFYFSKIFFILHFMNKDDILVNIKFSNFALLKLFFCFKFIIFSDEKIIKLI